VLKTYPLGSVLTIKDAINYPTISQQIKQFGGQQVVMVFIAEVTRNLAGFNVKENMSTEQIEMFCEDFISEYKYESIADLKIMFKKARLGHYGKTYAYIDSSQVMEWFGQYLNDKAEAREREHKRIKNLPPETLANMIQKDNHLENLKNEINKNEI